MNTEEKVEASEQNHLIKKQKKAAKRAAFIQQVAQAVVSLLQDGESGARSAAIGPFAVAYIRYEHAQLAADRQAELQCLVLWWAKDIGLLPATATELPGKEVQRHLLGTHLLAGL